MSSVPVKNDFNELDYSEFSKPGEFDLFGVTKEVFGDSLLLAIIETTTIGNESGVGTTQYISYKGRTYIENKIDKDYKAIIDRMKDSDLPGGPSAYFHWYRRDRYYYVIDENTAAPGSENGVKTLTNVIIPQKEKENSEQYIREYPKELTDPELKSFFSEYVRCLLQFDWFGELPNYFVLVKPLSVKDESTGLYIALGNLYLKIGTDRKIELPEYKKYVGLVQAAWFDKFGSKILREYSSKKISDVYKPKVAEAKTLATRLNRPMKPNEFRLNDFFYSAFDLGEHTELRKKHLLADRPPFEKFVNDLVENHKNKEQLVETIRGHLAIDGMLDATAEGLEKFIAIDAYAIKYFFVVLSKRRLALALLLVFNFKLNEAHEALLSGDRTDCGTEHSKFFNTALFIMQANTFEAIGPTIADGERDFLNGLIDKIRKTDPDFLCRLHAKPGELLASSAIS